MAEKRMFAKGVIDSDMFLDMPPTAQLLYFHLCMRADDDGFINNPKRIMRVVRAADDDMRMLIAKNYIIPFESGIVVVKHWWLHNYIQKDRYKPTLCDEKKYVKANNNKVYEILDTRCIQDVSSVETNCTPRLDKIRLDKINVLSGKPDHVKEIISILNDVANKNYKATTPKTRQLINARLNEGFNVDDFRAVIEKKYKQWAGSEMEKYMRPETLFGTKFEGYLNETVITEEPPKKKIVYVDEMRDVYAGFAEP